MIGTPGQFSDPGGARGVRRRGGAAAPASRSHRRGAARALRRRRPRERGGRAPGRGARRAPERGRPPRRSRRLAGREGDRRRRAGQEPGGADAEPGGSRAWWDVRDRDASTMLARRAPGRRVHGQGRRTVRSPPGPHPGRAQRRGLDAVHARRAAEAPEEIRAIVGDTTTSSRTATPARAPDSRRSRSAPPATTRATTPARGTSGHAITSWPWSASAPLRRGTRRRAHVRRASTRRSAVWSPRAVSPVPRPATRRSSAPRSPA